MLRNLFTILFIFISCQIYSQEINWVTLDQALELQKKNPKNIIMDVYTNWCGPCKLLDRNTFKNKDVSSFINKYYYAVKFNAEGDSEVNYDGRVFTNPNFQPEKTQRRNGTHQLTRYLNVSAYPTIIFMDKNSDLITYVRGYKTPQQLELWLKLFKDEGYKSIKTQDEFNKYYESFVPEFSSIK
tara:strand:+ start:167 stop:718 length:552 start_codon:yes stop_codon:yes gene_type:complete